MNIDEGCDLLRRCLGRLGQVLVSPIEYADQAAAIFDHKRACLP